MSDRMAINVDLDAGRRLKTYASAMGVSIQKLNTKIILEWLDKQPLVGNSQECGPRPAADQSDVRSHT